MGGTGENGEAAVAFAIIFFMVSMGFSPRSCSDRRLP
jgi:hypothetical protein